MKRLKLIALSLLTSITLFSCSSDDADIVEPQQQQDPVFYIPPPANVNGIFILNKTAFQGTYYLRGVAYDLPPGYIYILGGGFKYFSTVSYTGYYYHEPNEFLIDSPWD